MDLQKAIDTYAKKNLIDEVEYFLESQIEDDGGILRDKTLKEAYIDACDFVEESKIKSMVRQCRDIDIATGFLYEVSDEQRKNTQAVGGHGAIFIKHNGKFYDYSMTCEQFLCS